MPSRLLLPLLLRLQAEKKRALGAKGRGLMCAEREQEKGNDFIYIIFINCFSVQRSRIKRAPSAQHLHNVTVLDHVCKASADEF